MTPAQLLKHFGSVKETAHGLEKSEPCVRKWIMNDKIPYWSQLAIQLITNGKLKARK